MPGCEYLGTSDWAREPWFSCSQIVLDFGLSLKPLPLRTHDAYFLPHVTARDCSVRCPPLRALCGGAPPFRQKLAGCCAAAEMGETVRRLEHPLLLPIAAPPRNGQKAGIESISCK